MELRTGLYASRMSLYGTRCWTSWAIWPFWGSRFWELLWPTVLVTPCTPPWSPVFCGTRRCGRKLRTRPVKKPLTWKALPQPRLGLPPNFTKRSPAAHFGLSAAQASVRRLAGRHVLAVVVVERTFFQQFFKFCPSLVNEGSGKSAGRLLPFSGQILYSHVEQRDVLFKPAQGFLDAGNSEINRKHRATHRPLPRLPCFGRNASLQLNTCGTRFATTGKIQPALAWGRDGSRRNAPAGKQQMFTKTMEVYWGVCGPGMVYSFASASLLAICASSHFSSACCALGERF